MSKVVLYIAMSLDGYIADKNKGVSWLSGDGSDTENTGTYSEFIETVDSIILGSKTYDQIINELSPNEWVYKGKQTYVMTSKNYNSNEEIIFTNQNIKKLIEQIKITSSKNIWLCGGASIINQCHKLGLIDEYIITIIPIILGNGIKLFELNDMSVKLKLISIKTYNGIVDLKYTNY
ncbi:riboflavin biosynthesis protein RibD [Candidatus Epulonipiscioides gigas]|nr:riboflavin biosynthesis protein RibD [Epulopiscium sp. SCG-C07WGA-EpuloA2]